ncbi:M48 metallopeptidase family protein, partial [Campylobacter volucris]
KKVQKISIKEMVSRWGSCNHKKAYINLNLKLMQKPIKSIEYVILHELTHLIYPHHQKEFYAFLYNLMPDYKAREIYLKTIS